MAPHLSPAHEFRAKPTCSASRVDLALPDAARSSGTEAKNYCQRTIDFAKLAKREQPVRFHQPARIDGPQLLDQDARPLTVDFHLRPE